MAEDYSVNLKANLNTADVQEKLNDLRFKGTHATSDLEIAVKKLDNAVQDLTRTWQKQAEAARKAAENAEAAAKANSASEAESSGETNSFMGQAKGLLAARRLRGLKKIVEKVDGADGEMSEGGTVLASSLGWAGSGAAMGSAFGPAGTAIGALAGAIYGVKDGFDQLKNAADAAAKRLQAIADNNRREYREFLIGEQRRITKERTLEGIANGAITDARLKDYVDTYQKKKSEYEERIDRGAEDDQTEQDYLNEMKALKEQLEEYEKYSVAAQKELDKRAKAEEKASKAAEKKAAADERAAKRAQEQAEREFQRSVREEQQAQDQENRDNETAHKRLQALQFDETMAQWQKQVKEMPMKELLRTQTDLKKLYAELREKLKQELEDGDLGASDQTQSEIKEVAARLGAVDSVLSATGSGLGTISPLSDLNATGYSTVGNSSIGSAVQNLQLQENRKTNEILKSVDDVLTNMSTYVMEIRNKVESPSGNSATW